MSRGASFPFRSEAAREEYLAWYDQRAERWPVPSETRLVATSFGQTFVRVSGPANAPALVLLPGMSSSGLMWESLIEPLSRDFRAYAIDSVSDVGRSVATGDVRSAAKAMNASEVSGVLSASCPARALVPSREGASRDDTLGHRSQHP